MVASSDGYEHRTPHPLIYKTQIWVACSRVISTYLLDQKNGPLLATPTGAMQPSDNVGCTITDTLTNSTEVQNPQCKLDNKCSCLSNVFGSVLACAKFVHVSEVLLLALRTLSPITLPQAKGILHFRSWTPQIKKQALSGEWSRPLCSRPQVRSSKGPKPVVMR